MFQQNFDKWNSGNELIDQFIKKSQLNAVYTDHILEWIPYDRLKDIKLLDEGGFSTIYEAIWMDGPIKKLSGKNFIRYNNHKVALKCFNKLSNLNNQLLNEV